MKKTKIIGLIHTDLLAVCCISLVMSGTAFGAEGHNVAHYMKDANITDKALKKQGYSPYAGRTYPTQVFWGDQHLHTGWSVDAGAAGATLGPEEAVRFARGEEIISSTGVPAKLARPLDWIVVSDHSDMAGTIFAIRDGDPEFMKNPLIRQWNKWMKSGDGNKAIWGIVNAQSNDKIPEVMKSKKFAMNIWRKNTEIMEKYNEPGRFSAIIGYEWTSNAGGGDNLHRNVIYRDGKNLADQMIPYTTFESSNPEDLWKWMQAYEDKTFGSLLAIPHNGNLSNGKMFALNTYEGNPLTKEWTEARAKWEVLYEVVQMKCYGEAHPSLSPNDEFAGDEIWDKSNLTGIPKKPEMIQYEYLREALKHGLKLEEKFGTNPFKYGMAGGTDAHTALTAPEENNYFSKTSLQEPKPGRWKGFFINKPPIKMPDWRLSAAGWTGVWATENTREAIFDAMKRKETYGTTGARIGVRFFGGFDFTKEDAHGRHPAEVGYDKGVPMGGDLSNAPKGKSPSFLVAAIKDPLSGNLDRIQVIKGWMDKKGELHEKIYNVVWADADKRKPGTDGKLPSVGNTVDIKEATWSNTIGDSELLTVWEDPDFDANQRAFYYARVIEIPTPRWTAYDVKRFGDKMPEEVPMIVTERAYTSPIWYTPKQK